MTSTVKISAAPAVAIDQQSKVLNVRRKSETVFWCNFGVVSARQFASRKTQSNNSVNCIRRLEIRNGNCLYREFEC